MTRSTEKRGASSRKPKLRARHEGQSAPHDATTLIEESVVYLHALEYYCSEDLTAPELAFLRAAQRNLARIHRRLLRDSDGR